MIKKQGMIAAFVAAVLVALPASAEPILDFGYTSLDGDFVMTGADSGVLTAKAAAVSLGDLYNSTGYVNRIAAPAGVATFNPGFVAAADDADFNLTLNVSSITAVGAQAMGTLDITDVDGDALSMTLSGWLIPLAGQIYFNGLIDGAGFGGTGDGDFEGNTGQFTTAGLPGQAPYEGALTQLVFVAQWLDQGSFSNKSTLVTGTVVPEPAGLALLVLGAAAGIIRRR